MIVVENPCFRITLGLSGFDLDHPVGNYFIQVEGADGGKSYREKIERNQDCQPFMTLLQVYRYAFAKSTYWLTQSVVSPELAQTRIFDLSIIWRRFSLEVNNFMERYGEIDPAIFQGFEDQLFQDVRVRVNV